MEDLLIMVLWNGVQSHRNPYTYIYVQDKETGKWGHKKVKTTDYINVSKLYPNDYEQSEH